MGISQFKAQALKILNKVFKKSGEYHHYQTGKTPLPKSFLIIMKMQKSKPGKLSQFPRFLKKDIVSPLGEEMWGRV